MFARLKSVEPELLSCAALAAVLTLVAFLAQAHVGLAPQDEGYLWYGVEAVARGEWPMRDFRSYDPGRYLWCAGFEAVFGHGLLVLRAACAAFACIGLTAALLVVRRVVPSRAWLLPAGVLFALWQFPTWRPFDSTPALVATYVALRLVESPNARRALVAGLVTGLAAFFGRNHGLYAGVAFVLALAVAFATGRRERPVMRLAALAFGTVIGYLPMLALVAFVPGFARAFVESVLFFVGRSSLNIPFPATWPWTVDAAHLAGVELAAAYALSLVFVLFVVGYALLGLVTLFGRLGPLVRTPAVVAATCVGLPYVHLVAERSDVYHVAVSVPPLLLGVLALAFGSRSASGASAEAAPSRAPRRAGALVLAALLATSVLAIGTEQPLGRRALARGTPREFVAFDASGTELQVDGVVAQRLAAVRARITSTVPRDAKLLLSTKLLALYPLLDRGSPVWDVYPTWQADAAMEQRMLDELSSVDWVFLQDVAVGGVEEKRFANTYPGVWRRLQQDYERIPTPELPENFVFLHRR